MDDMTMGDRSTDNEAVLEGSANGASSPRGDSRVDRAVKSTASLVADAEKLLGRRQAKLQAERELAVLRACYWAQHGYEAPPLMKRDAVIGALAAAFGID